VHNWSGAAFGSPGPLLGQPRHEPEGGELPLLAAVAAEHELYEEVEEGEIVEELKHPR
jgi:hypothetical protein